MSSQTTKNRASGGASQCDKNDALLPTTLTATLAMFKWFSNVTKNMVEKQDVKCIRGHLLGKLFLYQDHGLSRGYTYIMPDQVVCHVCKRIALRKLARARIRTL